MAIAPRRRQQLALSQLEGEGIQDVQVVGILGEDLVSDPQHLVDVSRLDRVVEEGEPGGTQPLLEEIGVLAGGKGRQVRLGGLDGLGGVLSLVRGEPGVVGDCLVLLLVLGSPGCHGAEDDECGDEGHGQRGEDVAKRHVHPPK
jgi:hypothetical protein